MAKYRVRWKGKELGAFSRGEMSANLRSSKMGMLHQVFDGEQWVGLKKFLDSEIAEEQSISPKAESVQCSIAYFFAGLAFLNPYLSIISLGFVLYLLMSNSKKNAFLIFFLTIFFALLGYGFFRYMGIDLISLLKGLL